MAKELPLTSVERFFPDNDIIVSKTDLKGRLVYANKVFLDIADYGEEEVLGQPHSMIRHPEMPRCVFKLLWDVIQDRREIFAYVVNRAKNGDHYWVLAHVTPSYGADGSVIGYHSNRRVPARDVLDRTIKPLYASLRQKEEGFENRKEGLDASTAMLTGILKDKGIDYANWVFSL